MTDKPKVVSLTGGPLHIPGEPVLPIIEFLEAALDAARDGRVVACAVTTVDSEGWSLSHHYAMNHRISLVGAVGVLQYDMTKAISEG